MSKITQMYDKWLKAEHLRAAVVAQISSARIEQFDNKNGKESKYVIYFHQPQLKPLILNKSHAVAMADLAGTDDELQWTNQTVLLTPSKLPNGNGTIILSAPPAPTFGGQRAAPAPVEVEAADIPFQPGENMITQNELEAASLMQAHVTGWLEEDDLDQALAKLGVTAERAIEVAIAEYAAPPVEVEAVEAADIPF
jgi:hypothetical protein